MRIKLSIFLVASLLATPSLFADPDWDWHGGSEWQNPKKYSAADLKRAKSESYSRGLVHGRRELTNRVQESIDLCQHIASPEVREQCYEQATAAVIRGVSEVNLVFQTCNTADLVTVVECLNAICSHSNYQSLNALAGKCGLKNSTEESFECYQNALQRFGDLGTVSDQ